MRRIVNGEKIIYRRGLIPLYIWAAGWLFVRELFRSDLMYRP